MRLARIVLLLGFALLSTSRGFSQGPAFEWVVSTGAATTFSGGAGIAHDAFGNVYVAGRFAGTIDFDPGAGISNLTSAGALDIYVTKVDAAGNLIWAKRMGGTLDDYSFDVFVDAGGNVYATGTFSGTADFDPGAGTFNMSSTSLSADIFVLKLDASGNLTWARRIGSSSSDFGRSIAVSSAGNVITTGSFRGTVDFDPGAGISNLTSTSGGNDIFISKLDASGNFLWAKQMGGSSNDIGYAVALDAAENVFTTGSFSTTADFDPGASVFNLIETGNGDIFISKLDGAGNFVWAKGMGGTSSDFGFGIQVDFARNVYTTGYFENTVDFDPGSGTANLISAGFNDAFISKLDANGNYLWAKGMGGTSDEESTSLALDGYGNVYAAGSFESTVDFDPSPGTFNLTPTGSADGFVVKLNASGDFVWAQAFEGLGRPTPEGIDVDVYGSIYTTGYFNGTVDFDTGSGLSNVTAAGSNDTFIHKMRQTLTPPTISSFAPTTGPVGTTVIIDGTNFNTTPANNIVYFGATRATVTASTATQLTVTVPAGATYQPITVNVGGLMAYSAKPFVVTFADGGVIDACAFAAKVDFPTGSSPASVSIGDLDGDGKADLAVANFSSNTLSVFRNTGSGAGSISYATKVDFTSGSNPESVSIGDLDGDGKPDLAATNRISGSVSVFRNTSSGAGSISNAAKVDFTTGGVPPSVSIGDLDGDGKADLAVANYGSATVSVFLNTGSGAGSISYATKVDFTTGAGPESVSIGDLDGDGMADLAVANYNSGTVSVFRNTSSVGIISYAAKVDFTTGADPQSVYIGDLDGDGKADLVVANYSSSTVSVFRNTSSVGIISYAAKVDFTTGADPQSVSIGDLNGDGKADLAVANENSATVSVFRNTSSVGIISYAPKVDFATGTFPQSVSIGDLDGDGKADLAVANIGSNTVSVFRNTVSSLPPFTSSGFTPTNGPVGTVVTFTGTNFSTTPLNNTIKFNGVPTLVTASSSTSITAVVPAGATTGTVSLQIGCVTAFSVFPFTITSAAVPIITSFNPTSGPVGTTVVISGTNFDTTPANNTVKFNGTTATVTASTAASITTTVPAGASTGTITVTVAGNTATSASGFTITGGASITITTQPSNFTSCDGAFNTLATGTTNITYQWQKFNTSLALFQNVTDNANYSGSTTNTLTVTAATSSLAGDYRCAISGDFASTTFSNTATLTVPVLPPAPTTVPIVSNNCGVQMYNLTASSATAGEFRWYDVATFGVPQEINTTGNFTTPALSASTTYYVTFFDGVCESARTPSAITMALSGPGVLDKSFVPQPAQDGNSGLTDDMFVQPDNKIVVNYFTFGPDQFFVTRLLPDGTIDPAFQLLNGTLFNGYVDLIELQADGKILFAGRFSTISGTNYGYIARLNADGTLDGSFNTAGIGFNDYVQEMVIQPDGKIIVVGEFTSYNGTAANRIVRINPDGTIDGTFNVGSGADGSVGEVVIQADGKILISGNFSTYNSLPANGMARLNTNGSLDNSFNGVFSQVAVIALQADQKILIGGTFIQVGGVSRNYLARLNPDGSLDLTFDPGTGFDNTVYTIYVDPTSKILVGGWFQTANGEVRNFLARLYPDGSVDKFFNPGVGPNGDVYRIVPYGTNNVMVGGYIDRWNGQLQNGLSLINNECIRTPLGFDNTTCTNSITISACGGSNGQYRWYTDAVTATPIAGETNSTLSITNLSATQTYYVTLKDAVCESARVPVIATLNTAPSPAVTPSSLCGSGAVTLNASGGTNGQYRWYTVATGGTAITGQTNSSFTTPTLTATTTYYVSINNGTCESARTSVLATINPLPTAPTTTGASGCSPAAVILNASGGTNGQYRWYTIATGGTAITGQTNGTFTTPSLTTTITYFVSIDNGICESARTPVIATINPTPSAPTATGALVCPGTTVTLNASGGTAGQYRWYTVATGGTSISGQTNGSFTTPTLTATTTYYVSINNGCEGSRVAVIATVSPAACTPPSITTQALATQIGGKVTLNLVPLIATPNSTLNISSLQVTKQPASGAIATISPTGILTIDYTGISFSGIEEVGIRACDLNGNCAVEQFNIEVTDSITVYNAVSPTGANPTFFIQYIDLLPETKNNSVTIFDRWQNEVWKKSNYNNTSVVFSGASDSGTDLPTGIYFYKIEFANGRKTQTGFISLKR